MDEFKRFVEWAGSPAAAAKKLECSSELIYKILTGERGVSKATARKIVEVSGKRFSTIKLLFGDQTPA